jgi:hypothetical protein
VTFEEGSFEDFNGNEAEALTADGQCFETEFDMEPVLVETTPADLETDVSVNTNLEFVFSEDVWKGVVGKKIKVWNVDSGKVIAVDVTSAKVSGAGDTWTVDIPTLEYSTNYEVTIDGAAFYDSVGNPFAGLNGSDMRFRTEPTDVTAPLIVETDPADGDTDVDVNTDLTAYFSEPVRKGDVGKTIKIWKTATAQVVATVDVSSALVTIDDDVVTVVWPTLEFATDYYVTIDRGAFYDLAGNEFKGLAGSDLEFQTEPTDNIPPTLVSIETTDVDNNGVDTDTSLILTFSENVMAGNAPVLLMRKDNSSVVQSFIPSASKRLTIEDNVVTIKRDFWLRYATEYYVYVPAGSFIDDAGNAYLGNDNDTTEFLTEKKPAYLGKVTVSGSYNDGWRDFTVKMGAKFANSGYKLIRVERATGKLYVIRSGFLNEDGYAAIKADVNHLHRLDDVYVRIGRHYLAYHRVKTN